MAKINRINFTAGRIADFTCPADKSEAFLWDASVSGLGVRARRAGSRNYIHQSRIDGKTVRTTIGSVDAWDIAGARAEARRLQRLLDTGVTPREDSAAKSKARKTKAQRKAAESITLGDVWSIYVAAKRHKWSDNHIRDHAKAVQTPDQSRQRSKELTKAGALYSLLTLKLSELDEVVLSRWLEAETAQRPTVAARAYRLLSACLRWCSELGKPSLGLPALSAVVDVSALKHSTVKDHLARGKPRSDSLRKQQLAAWFKYVCQLENPVFSAYLQSLLLLGSRREELASLRWCDVDMSWGMLTIKDKVDGTRQIPLPPYVHSLLCGLPRRNEFVFYSPTSASGHIEVARASMVKVCAAAGLEYVTLHGLRRSFRNLSEWVEVPVGIVAQIQGHKPSATVEKHYTDRPLDLLSMWHSRIEGFILREAGIVQPAQPMACLRVVS